MGGGLPPPLSILDFMEKLKTKLEGDNFLWAISLRRIVVPSPKIVINLPRTYEKLRHKRNHIVYKDKPRFLLSYKSTIVHKDFRLEIRDT